MIPERNDSHVSEGLGLLIDAFKEKRYIGGFLATWLAQVQDLEAVLWEIIDGRYVDTAIGQQLTYLGDLVGEARLGRSDDELRLAVRLRIRTNRAQGTAEDVIQVTALVLALGFWQYTESNTASFQVLFWGLPNYYFRPLLDALRRVKPLGVRGELQYAPSPESEILFWFHTDGTTPARGGSYTHTDGLPRHVMVHTEIL